MVIFILPPPHFEHNIDTGAHGEKSNESMMRTNLDYSLPRLSWGIPEAHTVSRPCGLSDKQLSEWYSIVFHL